MLNVIACPSCHTEIEITEALQSQITTDLRRQLDIETKANEAKLKQAQADLAAKSAKLDADRNALKASIEAGVAAERSKITSKAKAIARKEAAAELELEMKDQSEQLADVQSKLKKARENELAIRKRERELEEQAEELKLAAAREVHTQREAIRSSAMKQFTEEHQLKDAEVQKLVSDLRNQIGELKRKAEQGSIQTQGEVQELALESMLESSFPKDSIEPVGKGVSGADCKQVVRCASGTTNGSILWESKRTKAFSKSWLSKLRDDQRTARASVAVIVSQAMPDGVETFAQINGIWVCSWQCAKGLAMALRSGLIEVGKSQIAAQGRVEKMELVYNYLAGAEFTRYVEGIVESFVEMESDLAKDKRAAKTGFNRREKQIERLVANTAGLYGDLQGIVGASLPAVEGLSMPLIESDKVVKPTSTVS